MGLPGKIIAYDDAMIAPEQPYCCLESIALTYQLEYAYVLIVYSHLSQHSGGLRGRRVNILQRLNFVKSGRKWSSCTIVSL